jgi:hypothetical protein
MTGEPLPARSAVLGALYCSTAVGSVQSVRLTHLAPGSARSDGSSGLYPRGSRAYAVVPQRLQRYRHNIHPITASIVRARREPGGRA